MFSHPARLAKALLLCVPVCAQQPAAQSSNQPPPPSLTTNSNLVLVPVVVTNGSGKHVPGLTKSAFQVEENGVSRPISVFEETTTAQLPAAKATPPGDAANLPANLDHPVRVTVILLDMVNTPALRQTYAKRQLLSWLLRTTSRDEPTVLFGLNSSGLHQLHPFTRDTAVLIDALRKLGHTIGLTEQTQPDDQLSDIDPAADMQAGEEEQMMSDFISDQQATFAAETQRIATRKTLVAMTQIAHGLEGIPGRKTLIWATAGFPFMINDPQAFGSQGDDLNTEYNEVWRALNSANIAVYPVDLNMLDSDSAALPSANATVSGRQKGNIRGINGMQSALNLPYDKNQQQRLTLEAFADSTGGRACLSVDELEKCFAQAVDDSRNYYLLGYYLPADTQPGWRKLKVNVSGQALHVRARTGFYVVKSAPDTPNQRVNELAEALASPVQYTGMPLTIHRLVLADGQKPAAETKKRSADFILAVQGDSLTFNSEKDNAIDLDVAAIAFDSNRKGVANSAGAVAVAFNPQAMQKIRATSLGIPEHLEVPSGKYEFKFAVRDNATGRVGTISLPAELR